MRVNNKIILSCLLIISSISFNCSQIKTGKEGKLLFFEYGDKADSIKSLKSIYTPTTTTNNVGVLFSLGNFSKSDQTYRYDGFFLIDHEGKPTLPLQVKPEEFFNIPKQGYKDIYFVFKLNKDEDIRDLQFVYKDKVENKPSYQILINPSKVELDTKLQPESENIYCFEDKPEGAFMLKYGCDFTIEPTEPKFQMFCDYNFRYMVNSFYGVWFSIKDHKTVGERVAYYSPYFNSIEIAFDEKIKKYKTLGFQITSLSKTGATFEKDNIIGLMMKNPPWTYYGQQVPASLQEHFGL